MLVPVKGHCYMVGYVYLSSYLENKFYFSLSYCLINGVAMT